MSTQIKLAAFAYLDPASEKPPTCVKQEVSELVWEFLEGHVAELGRKAELDTALPAEFEADGSIFAELLDATGEAGFLAAAGRAAAALRAEMNLTTKPGLFVALKLRDREDGPAAAVLKLDVVEEHAARLAREDGQVVLSIVEDLVDSPGHLQKGAAVPDPRSASDVTVGEKEVGPTAKYFLSALGISQPQLPGKGSQQLVKTVRRKHPQQAKAILERMESTHPATIDAFLEQVEDLLSAEERDELRTILTSGVHPVRGLERVEAVVTRKLEGEGITIAGLLEDMKRVSLEEEQGGSWVATVTFKLEPQEQYS